MKNLGKQGKHIITGYKGTIVAKCSYLTGCDQYCLKPKVDKDGKLIEGEWFDATTVEISDNEINFWDTLKEKISTNLGGPQMDSPKI